MLNLLIKQPFKNSVASSSVRHLCSASESQKARLRQAIGFRVSNLLDQLSQQEDDKKLFSQAILHTAHEILLAKPGFWEKEDKAMGARIAKLCKDLILPKTTISQRIMYSDEYKKLFLPQASLVDFQLKLLCSTEFDPKGFKKLESSISEFELLEEVSPSFAIESFIKGPTIADCGSAIEAIFFKALKDEIGEPRFDALFSRSDLRLRITHKGPINHQSLINLFTKYTLGYIEGARCYFEGHPGYTQKHGNGIGLGLHALIADGKEPLFWGLGQPGFQSESQICEYLLAQYEKDPEDNLLLALKKAALDEQQTRPLNASVYRTIALGGLEYVDRLSPEMIHLITQSSIEEIGLKDFKRKLVLQSAVIQAKTLIKAK